MTWRKWWPGWGRSRGWKGVNVKRRDVVCVVVVVVVVIIVVVVVVVVCTYVWILFRLSSLRL
jgi:hypothetical protein